MKIWWREILELVFLVTNKCCHNSTGRLLGSAMSNFLFKLLPRVAQDLRHDGVVKT